MNDPGYPAGCSAADYERHNISEDTAECFGCKRWFDTWSEKGGELNGDYYCSECVGDARLKEFKNRIRTAMIQALDELKEELMNASDDCGHIDQQFGEEAPYGWLEEAEDKISRFVNS